MSEPKSTGLCGKLNEKVCLESASCVNLLVHSTFFCLSLRRREIFVGRLAMTGFFSAVIGELLTGKGALGQLGLETRLPQPVVNWLVIAIVGFNVITALNPFGSTFSKENQQDVRKRPTGAVQNPKKNIVNDPKVRPLDALVVY